MVYTGQVTSAPPKKRPKKKKVRVPNPQVERARLVRRQERIIQSARHRSPLSRMKYKLIAFGLLVADAAFGAIIYHGYTHESGFVAGAIGGAVFMAVLAAAGVVGTANV